MLIDGFTSALMAIEGITDSHVFLHGPGGCRLYHMIFAASAFPRLSREGTYSYNVPYFFGHPRIPCSYIDGSDYVDGAYWKLEEGLGFVKDRNASIMVVIDSPGASLIGDDCCKAIHADGLDDDAFHLDQWLISTSASDGFDMVLTQVLEKYCEEPREKVSGRVNILGLSVMDRDWTVVKKEISDVLSSMGLEAGCFLGAGCTLDEIRKTSSASANITLCPEMSTRQAKYLEDRFGIPCIRSDYGSLVGFDAVRDAINKLAAHFGKDPSGALALLEEKEHRIFDIFIGTSGLSSRFRGMTFSVAGMPSIVLALTEWLYDFLLLVPKSIAVDKGDSECVEKLKSFLSSIGCENALKDQSLEADLLFADESTSRMREAKGLCKAGVPIGFSYGGMSVLPRPMYMASGAMHLLDETTRALRGFDSH